MSKVLNAQRLEEFSPVIDYMAPRNPDLVYSLDTCQMCSKRICHARSENSGNVFVFDYPESPIFPNASWTPHTCPAEKSE